RSASLVLPCVFEEVITKVNHFLKLVVGFSSESYLYAHIQSCATLFITLWTLPDRESSMPRSYVDNAYNRRVGRVGMPVGSMVISRSSGGGGGGGGGGGFSSGGGSGFSSGGGSGYSYGGGDYSGYSGSSTKTYVDNPYNRSVGRVGLPVGSMPISKSGSGGGSYGSADSYVDNAYNRAAGRVGMPMGSMPIHKGESASGSRRSYESSIPELGVRSNTYVDNAYNRSAGRVGMPMGSMPIHKGESASGNHRSYESSSLELIVRSKTYVDNAYNRSHDRVGMERGLVGLPKGSAPVSRKDPGSTKVYVDNYMNRKLDCVGKIVGTAVYHKKTGKVSKEFYANSPQNQKLDRAGKPRGCRPVSRKCGITKGIPKMLEKLQNGEEAVYRLNRQNEEMEWKKAHGAKPKTRASLLTNFQESIPFSELSLSPEKKIGEGTFGEVFLTEWNGSAVAVKKLKVTQFSKRLEDDFKREILTFSALDHPSIVKFLGACVERPNFCIVMEYMQMSLYDALHTVPDITFTETERLDIITDVCKGIQYLHCERIAHCDLKTLNILINYTEGKTCIAKITDFGLSLVKNSTQSGTSSRGGAIVCYAGTPRYSAPEVLRGEMLKASDMMKADIWSLGLVIFETIFDEEPFYNLSLIQLKKQVGEKGLKPEINDDIIVNPDVMTALFQTWRNAPRDRIDIGELTEVVELAQYLYVQ
ncbi:CTR1-like protein, partial [Mya arenaria]